MDYLTTYWDTCCIYKGGYAEKQYNYMPSLICKSILTKNCNILFEPPSYYCTLCIKNIHTNLGILVYETWAEMGK